MGFADRRQSCVLSQRGDALTLRLARPADAVAAVDDQGASRTLGLSADGLTVTASLASLGSAEPRTWRIVAKHGEVTEGVVADESSRLVSVPSEHGDVTPTLTGGGRVVVLSGGARPPVPRTVTRSVWSTRRAVHVAARLWLPEHGEAHVTVVLRERGTDRESRWALPHTSGPTRAGARSVRRLRLDIPWARVVDALPGADVVDLWIDVAWESLSVRAPVLGARTLGIQRLRSCNHVDGDAGHVVTPFLTFKARRLALRSETVDRQVLEAIRRDSRLARVRGWWRRLTERGRRPLWVIGERPERFQDTAFAFFAWASENLPGVDVRAVVAADSPDAARAARHGTVLHAGTVEHARAVLRADRIIGSHHPDYLYPLRSDAFRRDVRGLRVFLQHGVMGTKWMANLYGRGAAGFETDLVIASSERERDLLVRDFGYTPRQIAVTGLARFDTLLSPGPAPARRLLVIPTWRDWLTDPDEYAASDYHAQWHGLLTDPRFTELCEQAGLEVVLSLHPNMRAFVGSFEDAGVTVVHPGERAVQDMIIDSAVLLTDFSSVGFDAALLHRPVLYFQFDRDRFLGRAGSHLDLDSDLPGEIAFTRAGMLAALRAVIERGLEPTEDAVRVADSYYPQRDQGANARIAQAIQGARRTRDLRGVAAARALRARLGASAYRRLRRSSLYLPLCKAVFRAASLLPRDADRVVFESGVGRQFGDSPRAIYEELLRRRPDMRMVWAYNGRPADIGGGAEVVKRLSLRYFAHLGRARYWVSNQSLPHYVTSDARRRYIQTWHGTPLKRMLHDLDQVTGRDAGYVQRATTAAQQWSVLLSPNPYSTARMRSAFQYRGRIEELGYPRNDVLFGRSREHAEARVRRTYRIPLERRIVLFAPTFRDDQLGSRGSDGPAGNIDPSAFAAALGDRAVLLVRKHVLDRTQVVIPDDATGMVVDASAYPDTQDLLAAADVLVTDYSSLFFDFANLRRPMIFHVPDLDRYRDQLRGFYLDMETDLPGPLTRTTDQVIAALGTALRDGVIPGHDVAAFATQYCPRDDGRAAARVVERLMTDGA